MNIHQVSVSYVQEQDRLLIRISGKEGGELRAWLTRRLALALLPILSKTATEQMKKIAGSSEPAASLEQRRGQLVEAFKKEASLREGDFDTPYQSQQDLPGGLPLGPEPLLLTEVQITQMSGGQLRMQMFEKLPGQDEARNFQVMMDPQLSNGFLHLLHQSLKGAQWLQVPALPTDAEEAADSDVAPMALDEAAKPKYLN